MRRSRGWTSRAGVACRRSSIGRTSSSALETAYARAAAGHGCAIVLEGDAGAGKSRLIREFVAARSGVRVLEARCTRWRDDFGFHPMRVLTRRLLGLDASENVEATHARLERAAAAPGGPPPGSACRHRGDAGYWCA